MRSCYQTQVKIKITKDYQLQFYLINPEENRDIFVTLKEDEDNEEITEYPPCITFNKNTISVCKDNDKAIHFVKKWFVIFYNL